jgi:hypothetical protein
VFRISNTFLAHIDVVKIWRDTRRDCGKLGCPNDIPAGMSHEPTGKSGALPPLAAPQATSFRVPRYSRTDRLLAATAQNLWKLAKLVLFPAPARLRTLVRADAEPFRDAGTKILE